MVKRTQKTRRAPKRDAQRASRRRSDPEWAEELRSSVGDEEWNTDKSKITLEMISSLRPFTGASEEDGISVPVNFRIPARLYRDIQRIHQKTHGRYDLQSDLYRDIFTKGVFVVAYSLRTGLPLELAMSLVKYRKQFREDVVEKIATLGRDFENMDRDEQVDLVEILRETISLQSLWAKKVHENEIKKYPALQKMFGSVKRKKG